MNALDPRYVGSCKLQADDVNRRGVAALAVLEVLAIGIRINVRSCIDMSFVLSGNVYNPLNEVGINMTTRQEVKLTW